MSGFLKFVFWAAVIGIGFFVLTNSDSKSPSYSSDGLPARYSSDEYTVDEESNTISYGDAISEYWDDIKSYVDGTEEVEACYYGNGNCYTLEADISSGDIETIYFNNGGYISLTGELDSNGEADATDDEGNDWHFTLDMDSSTVESAVDDWAADNDYTIE